MRVRMRTRILAAAALAGSAALLTAPAQADAAYWKGKTAQGKAATVRTAADGLVSRVRIRWEAPCGGGKSLFGVTPFTRPFDRSERREFEDGGRYRARANRGLRTTNTVFVRGTRRRGVWRGTFHARATVRRDGRVIDRCRLGRTRWSARRVRGTAAAAALQERYWKGRTRQGRRATVRTGADGLVTSVRIRWRARCGRGARPLKGGTRFVRPIDRLEPRSFEDGGKTPPRQLDDGVVVRDAAFVQGKLGSSGVWRGTFHVRAVFKRGDRVLLRCRMKTRWRARPVG
jgi:hypothetical protein